MIVRELLAIFGLDYQGDGEKKAKKAMEGLQRQAQMLQTAFTQVLGAAAIASPFIGLIKMASDAQENLNLLQLAFGENADDMVAWSNEVGPAIGRSRYTMRELAAEFGGLLQPMVGTGEELANMSKGLAQLAVDLSSARNVPENEALAALQSGLSGNIIAMKRFGVNLSATRVEQEAMARGLGKNTKELTQGQLATIRYSLIMKDLAFIQGDAANTLDQFANSSRATRDALKDIGTELGFFLLPAAEDTLKTFRNMLQPVAKGAAYFRQWAADTNLAGGALTGVAVIMGALLLPLLLKMVPLVLAFAVFAIIMDDVITAFQGGNSVFKAFGEWLDQIGDDLPAVGRGIIQFMLWPLNRLRDALGVVLTLLSAMVESASTGSIAPLKYAVKGLGEQALEGVQGVLQGSGEGFLQANQRLLDWAKQGAQGAANFIGGAPGALQGSATVGGASVQNGDRTYNFNLQQQPGESSEDFSKRVAEELERQADAREQALFSELVQQGG